MLQKPSMKSKAKDHSRYLQKRLQLWIIGDLHLLISECIEIRRRLVAAKEKSGFNLTQSFSRLMLAGNLSQASKIINRASGGVLEMNDNVKQLLYLKKHPKASIADSNYVLSGPEQKVKEVFFENIDGEFVCKVAKLMSESGGPTLIDCECWNHMLCFNNFKVQQRNLCDAIAKLAKQLCTTKTTGNFTHFKELFSCCLIPLDKCPGVRPIGIGEVLRRIIGKCVMRTLKLYAKDCVGSIQECGGQQAGIEAAIHAMHEIYN